MRAWLACSQIYIFFISLSFLKYVHQFLGRAFSGGKKAFNVVLGKYGAKNVIYDRRVCVYDFDFNAARGGLAAAVSGIYG